MNELDGAIDARDGPVDVAQDFLPGARGRASRGVPDRGIRGPGDVGPREWPGRCAPREPKRSASGGRPCVTRPQDTTRPPESRMRNGSEWIQDRRGAAGPAATWDSRPGIA